jgi:hypothetical protein
MAIWCERIACWVTKATDTHSRICNTNCSPSTTTATRTHLHVTLDVPYSILQPVLAVVMFGCRYVLLLTASSVSSAVARVLKRNIYVAVGYVT